MYLMSNASHLEIEREINLVMDSFDFEMVVHTHKEGKITELFILQIRESPHQLPLGANVYEFCDGTVESLCFVKYIPMEKWTSSLFAL